MPTIAQMARGMFDAALRPAEEDEAPAQDGSLARRFLNSMLWKDTKATSRRFFLSMILLIPAVLIGLHMGLFPYVGAFFLRFVLFFDKIVALSLLPILFIAFGIDELSKIMLIVIGVAPTIILDTVNLARSVPREQIVKGFTLGAGDFAITYRIVLKQIFPRVLNSEHFEVIEVKYNKVHAVCKNYTSTKILSSVGVSVTSNLLKHLETAHPHLKRKCECK